MENKKTGFTILILILGIFINAFALKGSDKFDPDSLISSEEIKQAITEAKSDSINANKGFEDLIKDLQEIEGLFTMYKNEEDGTVYLQINPEQFGIIYLCTMTRQSGDAYMFDASSMLWNFPFFFKKVNNRIQMIQKNLSFRADEEAMSRALEKSISNSIIASTNIVGKPHSETGAILIKAADIFLRDMANVEYVTDRYKAKVNYDKENSYFGNIKSFPLNSEIDVILHFKSGKWRDVYTLPDSRSMIHKYHYSLSTIPETDYKARKADDRIGCFTTIYQDYSDLLDEESYVRYINRWNLKKKNPNSKLSKPVEPIVFWLENTIPDEFKKPVKEGILLWNEAYEEIGFKDAIVVKEMPEDADWDPADARYNTICWIVQPGGGYAVGPSHANPYTGELYDADIRISIDFVRFYTREFGDVVVPGSSFESFINSNLPIKNTNRFYEGDAYAEGLSYQMSYAWNFLTRSGTFSGSKKDLKKFVDMGIKALVVHEVGHTLGFRHNFKASTYYTNEQIQDEDFVKKHGIVGSVMDYVPAYLAPLHGDQVEYFQLKVGEWDKWVVEYAYSEFDKDEDEKLGEIASKGALPYHDYGTDEDSYGRGARGMDPNCNVFDMSSDIIENYIYRLELANYWWDNIIENFQKEGESYTKFRDVFGQGWSEYNSAAGNVVKFIGGIYSHRDHIGDPNGRPPFEIVPAAKQREALDFLMKNMFAADAFEFDPDVLNKLVPEKNAKFTNSIWSYDRQEYKIHNYVNWIQSIIYSHVFNPRILARITDNEVKFPKHEEAFTMAELFDTIRTEVWQELDEEKNINSYRRNLQKKYIENLGNLILKDNDELPADAVALARFNIKKIQNKIEAANMENFNTISQAHLDSIADDIFQILYAQREQK
ncbi:MAG: zinc-dependent metalloprotease [Candidatus Cloacimonetes bacterium]|nr:zinc-dependent metalloprotease [Candidatus Cloacimonadota bacterium]MCF7814929.1 zinc-dependent metalloprotease [Candidatus Cloacimonadota bacterium]MCF7868145.1 zinc-dependent metalloprotease [Candidatus Cloacimonadota bacterium]MCF7883611.1 zinc-dependent metalloprotease [Candidatus Cloacimonadota bacterium]